MATEHRTNAVAATRRSVGLGLRLVRKVVADAQLVTHSDAVALTFDDGPHPSRTPVILDVLAAHGATATFFVLGAEAAQHPHLVQRIVAEGHALGTHTMSHPDLHKVSATVGMADIRAGRDAVEQIAGCSVPLFRPPKGHLTVNIGAQLRRGDWRTWLWSVDAYDWKRDTTALSVQQAAQVASAGDVIVMHDTMPAAVEALPLILEHVRRGGWEFCTLK